MFDDERCTFWSISVPQNNHREKTIVETWRGVGNRGVGETILNWPNKNKWIFRHKPSQSNWYANDAKPRVSSGGTGASSELGVVCVFSDWAGLLCWKQNSDSEASPWEPFQIESTEKNQFLNLNSRREHLFTNSWVQFSNYWLLLHDDQFSHDCILYNVFLTVHEHCYSRCHE